MESKVDIPMRMRVIKASAEGIYRWCKKHNIDIEEQDAEGERVDSYLTDILCCSDLECNIPELWTEC